MGCMSSSAAGLKNEEAAAKTQRRRLSVAPQHVGDVAKTATLPLGADETQDEDAGLTDVEKTAKGGLEIAILSKKGVVPYSKKKVNQDRPVVKFALDDNKDVNLYGVMDGHGEFGHYVASFVQESLPKYLAEEKTLAQNPETSIKEGVRKMCNSLLETNINIAFSGTTCVFGVQVEKKLYVANIGDSRCVMARHKGNNKYQTIDLSEDQKPENPKEKARIIAAGGRVEPLPGPPGEDCGPPRVWLTEVDVPGLAMSRSIGDEVSQTVGVISVPEIKVHDLEETDIFAIWASDGVWEFITSEQAVDLVVKTKGNETKADWHACAKALVDESVKRWKHEEEVIDDITVVIVGFNKSK
jgi:serine/threonine protein phosphatase PrpC